MDPAVRDRVEAACRRGGSSLHSTGSSPGFITEAMPLVLTSLQRKLDHLVIEEFADMSSRNSPELLFDLMGFGRDPALFDPRGGRTARWRGAPPAPCASSPKPSDCHSTTWWPPARWPGHARTVEVAAGSRRGRNDRREPSAGARDPSAGRLLLTFSANWYLTKDLDPEWELRQTGWHLVVDGDAPLDVDIRFPVAPEVWPPTSPGPDGAPPGQRRSLGVRGPPGDPDDRGPASDHPEIPPERAGGGDRRRGMMQA